MLDYSKYFSIEEYYRKVVIPLNEKKFKKGSSGKFVCPIHNDTDPSLGVVKSSKSGEVCHCFGCGVWLDVVGLHIEISKKYKKKYLDREEARKELCSIFGVKTEDLPDESEKNSASTDERREELMSEIGDKFDISDFRYRIIDGKLKKRGIGYFNALMMSMIWEMKNQE